MRKAELDAAIERLVQHQYDAYAKDNYVEDEAALKKKIRNRMYALEHEYPGWVSRNMVQVDAGRRLTGCREVRGTHAIDYVWDPEGTDTPPEWWNRDEARAIAERRNERARLARLLPDDD